MTSKFVFVFCVEKMAPPKPSINAADRLRDMECKPGQKTQDGSNLGKKKSKDPKNYNSTSCKWKSD